MPEGPQPQKLASSVVRSLSIGTAARVVGFALNFARPKFWSFPENFNDHGYHPPYLAKEEACTGCDLCGLYCPDFAIYGVRVPRTDD